MSGYGKADDEQENIFAVVENGVDLARSRITSGPSSETCHDCGITIPLKRRQVVPGCKYCITCQALYHDQLPKIKAVTYML